MPIRNTCFPTEKETLSDSVRSTFNEITPDFVLFVNLSQQSNGIAVLSLSLRLILRHAMLENRMRWKKHKRRLNLNCHIRQQETRRNEERYHADPGRIYFVAFRASRSPAIAKSDKISTPRSFWHFHPFYLFEPCAPCRYGKLLCEFPTNDLLINIDVHAYYLVIHGKWLQRKWTV